MKKIELASEQKEKIIRLYKEGISTNNIEKAIGVSRKIIVRFLKNTGIQIRYQLSVTEEQESNIIAYVLNSNDNLKDVANKFNLSFFTIHRILKKNNISKRQLNNIKYKIYEKEVIDLYLNDSLSIKEIIQKSNVKSESKIFKILADNNIPLKKKKCDYSISDNVIEMYKSGNFKVYEIAKALNVSKSNITKILNKENIEITIGVTKNIENKIIDLYTSKLISLDNVAKKFNLTNTTISNILKRNNIKRRGHSQAKIALSDEEYEEYLKTIPEFIKYRRKVLWVTNQQKIQTLENFDKRGKAGQSGAYNLDHKYSIIEGFKNNIEPKIIGNINNLEMLPWKDNVKKHKKCSITLNELLNQIEKHENKKS